jgi:RNA polymerase sigma-70 factor (ECF subfamily)
MATAAAVIMRRMIPSAAFESESDAALMRRFASGEAKAFDALYDRHESKVWRFILRSVRNRASAEELMQEVWFGVARQARTWQPEAKFTTWLFTLARHRMIDAHRAGRVAQATQSVDQDGSPIIDSLPAGAGSGPAEQLETSQQRSRLIAAVECLPPEQREAFLLQAEAELSVIEIAALTEVTFETAKSRLRYARVALKSMLKEFT